MESALGLPAPAKLNLFLHVTGRRGDGYHTLQTVFQLIDLADWLDFERRDDGAIVREGDLRSVAEEDLAVRAARALQQATGCRLGATIRVTKRIPAGSGMGGGSSDAATTLVALNRLWDLHQSRADLGRIALPLGADVPFFLQDRPALATGRGERLEPLEPFPAMADAALVLVYPGFGISTAWAYQQLARFPAALNGRPGRARPRSGTRPRSRGRSGRGRGSSPPRRRRRRCRC